MTQKANNVKYSKTKLILDSWFSSLLRHSAAAAPKGAQTGLCPDRQIFHFVMRHEPIAFHSTILHADRGQLLALMAPVGRILKAKFRNFPVLTSISFAGGNYPISHPPSAVCASAITPLLGYRPSCPLEVYDASLDVPQQEQIPSTATDRRPGNDTGLFYSVALSLSPTKSLP